MKPTAGRLGGHPYFMFYFYVAFLLQSAYITRSEFEVISKPCFMSDIAKWPIGIFLCHSIKRLVHSQLRLRRTAQEIVESPPGMGIGFWIFSLLLEVKTFNMAIKKTERITIRFEPKPMQWIERKAKKSGVSIGRYVREVALCQRSQEGEEIGRAKELKEMKTEVIRIGNNLNQIAKVANTSGQINEKRLYELGEKMFDLQMKIDKELAS